ncbi:MAG: carbohydrate kinase [Thiohalomonadaceae bacterium]
MAKATQVTDSAHPLIFGEVLYDCFPDGSQVLGGAPFNVAWHLQGFGLAPLLLSRVGTDAVGDKVITQMHAWGMDTSLMQHDKEHATGIVTITMQGTQHSFEIKPDQAYDHIDQTQAAAALREKQISLLYHGSLAMRGIISRQTLHWLRNKLNTTPLFIDINLRAPFWQADAVRGIIQHAAWVKLNEDELQALSANNANDNYAAQQFAKQHNINHLLLTRGADGALLVDGDALHESPAAPVANLVDTVGAGDAFTAVMLYGLARTWPLPRTLCHASEFAAAICTQRGAINHDQSFYDNFIKRWEDLSHRY